MPPWPSKGNFPPASHVETKYAVWMKKNGVQHAKVVINNNEGVCNSFMNCRKAVEAILPVGSTMKVYYPGDGSPRIIVGMRTKP
ncbi:DddA-like double-stranded DNA deaminase toxin [Streptomyces sp. NPDC058685]|uniref:DddA-like double-stranded DNA deaminase toxin n=1 Tax=Streptomyces sp. NPDC058685 TaxID=3346598 RepID=UPI0036604174